VLSINNIEVVYDSVILVLRGVSLEVKPGSITTLLGANGAGKTTTLKAISGVLRTERGEVTKGSVTFDDKRIDGMRALAEQAETGQVDVSARLADLYVQTLSRLAPRILVEGNPTYLQQSAQVDQIRALLLAAVRAAVLWRQLGGTQMRLLFRRRQYAMMARGLLAGCTLGGS